MASVMPAFDILPLFSTGRSRRLTLVPIIRPLAKLEKNHGKEEAEIIQDNVQDTIFGGFATNSKTAEALSKALGNRTVMSGTISRGKSESGQSLQMIQRPLMTPDELKSLPKGHFIVMKTGTHPMRTRLRLFLEWGITFGKSYQNFRLSQRALSRTAIIPQEGTDETMSYFNEIYGDLELNSKAKMVLLYLHDRANQKGESWYAIGTIARELSISRSSVKRALNELLKLGKIKKQTRFRGNGGSTSNWYQV